VSLDQFAEQRASWFGRRIVSDLPILLLGAGGHARACIDVIEQEGRFRVGGLVGTQNQVGERVCGYPVLGTDVDVPRLVEQHAYSLVAVGQIKSPELRIRLFDMLNYYGFVLPMIVSPRAYVSPHAVVAAGTVVMHGAIVNAGATVGRNCILNSQSLVEHDAHVGDHCHVATAAAINSGVRVGAGSFIGSNSCVRQGILIGERCVIGMGQNIVEHCSAGAQIPAARGLL
jgi:sugar O-acyltransferase (sialic acid O-acetyltransferase NeuD family)